MKKYFVVLAALAMVFVGCKKEEKGGSEYTKVALKQTEISLAIGESQKLNVIYEPTTLDAPVCTWSTSNADVATVENGTVTGVSTGEANITAKYGEFTAVCKVIVADPRTLYNWGGIARFSDLEPFEEGAELPVYDVQLSDGVYKCHYGMATYYFWDDGVYIDGQSLAGEGYIFAMEVPCYVIAEGDYAGSGVGSPIYLIDKDFDPADTTYAYCVRAGSLGDVNDWADWVLNEESQVNFNDCWKGPECMIFSEGKFYYPSFPGILNEGFVYGTYQAMGQYNFSATWADEYYGLAIDETGEALKEPYEWATITCDYLLQPESAAPKANVVKKINTNNLKKAVKPIKMLKSNDKLVIKK